MHEDLARVLLNVIYILWPESQSDKCLGIFDKDTNGSVQISSGTCNDGI
jgi:hypothetical protein